jgi:hypothetical protein
MKTLFLIFGILTIFITTSCADSLRCFEPIAIPVCPTPKIEENPNSYNHGYNRGFITAQRKNS